MKKVSRIITSVATLAMAGVMAACSGGGGKGGSGTSYKFDFWTGFGTDYTSAIEGVVNHYNELNSGKIELVHTRKKDYNTLRTEVLNSRSQKAYPNFTCGYPDHFADYNEEKFLLSLDTYIERYDEEHKSELQAKGYNSIIDDYYPEYMKENKEIAYDDEGNALTVGVPFNKSTEVLVTNGFYFDFFKEKAANPANIKVPTTWEEVATVSAEVQNVVTTLDLTNADNKYIIGTISADKKSASGFRVSSTDAVTGSETVIQDISNLTTATPFYTLGYDSGENAFITLLHQWGVPYTTEADGGKALFWKSENQAATSAVLEYFRTLNAAGAFGVPEVYDESQLFCTKALEQGRCLFTVGSSGGLSKPKFKDYRLRISAIPYHQGGEKKVISQGTSLGLLNKYVSKETYYDEMYNAFCAMVDLTTGDLQAEWVTTTGYFPSSKTAYNSKAYQDLLHNTNPTRLEQLYRDAGTVNGSTYVSAQGWTKFVDPGFPASNSIRVNVGDVLKKICKTTDSVESIMQSAWNAIDAKLK